MHAPISRPLHPPTYFPYQKVTTDSDVEDRFLRFMPDFILEKLWRTPVSGIRTPYLVFHGLS